MICGELGQEDGEELAIQLGLSFNEDESLQDQLKTVPWSRLKQELELIGKTDLIKTIKKRTLITKGIFMKNLLKKFIFSKNSLLKIPILYSIKSQNSQFSKI